LPILESRDLPWPDEAACAATARTLAGRPGITNALVTLHGDLGAGKTTFTRHLLQALGVQGRVKSPTYALMEVYELPAFTAWHFDFYRFDDPQEWEDAGFREVFASPGLKLVEWPEKAVGLLPVPDLRIDIALVAGDGDGDATTRQVRLGAATPLGLGLLP